MRWRAPRGALRDPHAAPRRRRRRGGRRGDAHRREAGCGCRSPTSSRAAATRRAGAAWSGRAAPATRPRRRVRHAHARCSASRTSPRCCRPGRSAPSRPELGGDPARPATRGRDAKRTAASSAPAATGAASCCWTTRSGPSTPAATSPRSPPSAGRSRSTPSTTCCSRRPTSCTLMVIIHCHTERQQREAFAHPLCMPGSDATTLAPDGPLADSVFHGAYRWAAWFYRFMVRDERLLTPQEAVRRLTVLPAERLGLPDRGVLREGARRRRRLRRRAVRRARDDVRAEPARRGHASTSSSTACHAARRRADRRARGAGAAPMSRLTPAHRGLVTMHGCLITSSR